MSLTLLLLLAAISGGNLALGFVAGRYLGFGAQPSPPPTATPPAE